MNQKTVVIRAKFMFAKRIYRDIEIPTDFSLELLAGAIVDSFGWDLDHAFGFYSGMGMHYHDSAEQYEVFADMSDGIADFSLDGRPEPKGVQQTEVGSVFREPKQKMQFLFDYGDDHRFELEVRGFGSLDPSADYPRILAVRGEAPPQYPPLEEEDEEEE